MWENNIYDSRDMDEESWIEVSEDMVYPEELKEFLDSGDNLFIPEAMDFMSKYRNLDICGGGVHECLLEVEILLEALNINYNTIRKFTY